MKLADNKNKNIMTTQTSNALQTILDQRHIPEGYYLTQSELPSRVYFKEANGKFYSLGFRGRAIKATFNYVFRTEAERESHLNRFFASVHQDSVRKAERQAKKKAQAAEGHSLQVDDIMVCNWGYDQTNIDYYQVTKLIGSTMVELRPIKATVVESSGYYDKLMPIKNDFITSGYKSETLRKRVNPGSNSVGVYSFANAYKWDGRAEEQTALGYGH